MRQTKSKGEKRREASRRQSRTIRRAGVSALVLMVLLIFVGVLFMVNPAPVRTEVDIDDPAFLQARLALDVEENPNKARRGFEKVLETMIADYGEGSLEAATVSQHLAGVYSELGRETEALELFDRAYVIFKRELGMKDETAILALSFRGMSYLRLRDYDRAYADLTDSIGATRSGDHRAVMELYLAKCLAEQGKYQESMALDRRLVTRWEQNHLSWEQIIEAATDACRTAIIVGDYDGMLPWFPDAVARLEAENAPDSAMIGAYIALSNLYTLSGKTDLAAETAAKAAGLEEALTGDESFHVYNGTVYSGDGALDPEKAAEQLAIVAEASRRNDAEAGLPSAMTASILEQLGNCHLQNGDYPAAEQAYLEALDIHKALVEEKSDRGINLYVSLWQAYRGMDAPEQATDALRHAIHFCREMYGEDTLRLVRLYTWMGHDCMDRNALDDAQTYADLALELGDRLAPEQSHELAGAKYMAGNLALRKGELSRAEALYRESQTLWRRLRGGDSIDLMLALVGEGTALFEEKDYSAAGEKYGEAYRIYDRHPKMQAQFSGMFQSRMEKLHRALAPETAFDRWAEGQKTAWLQETP